MHTRTIFQAAAVLSVVGLSAAQALTTVPDIATATQTTQSANTSPTSATSQATSQNTQNTAQSTSNGGSTSNSPTTNGPTSSLPPLSSNSQTSTTTSTSSAASGSSALSSMTTGFPTIAGAGIPTMIVPYTAAAPFMQHSDLPQGTVFIAVGAVLAFLGLMVLLWRGLVAWSINRSVKRAALASIRSGAEKPAKNWGTVSTTYGSAKGGIYKDIGASVSMEALTPTGKQIKSHTFKDHDSGRSTPPPPSGLFFSPTAHAQQRNSTAPPVFNDVTGARNSSYLPAGYYAQPSSHAAGGARNTTIGGPLPPYARNSAYESPPGSPALRPSGNAVQPRPSYDTLRPVHSRDGMRNTVYSQMSNSSLTANVGGLRPGSAGHAGQRAPSAYLEDLFENSTAMASKEHL